MTDAAEVLEGEVIQEEKPKPKPRPKMALADQSAYLINLLRRCEMHDQKRGTVFAGQALLAMTEADMVTLDVIQQTLAVFELHRADQLVKDKILREMKGRGR